MELQITALIDRAVQYLQDNKYASEVIANYRRQWSRFLRYCYGLENECPLCVAAKSYLSSVFSNPDKSDGARNSTNRAVQILLDIEAGREVKARYTTKNKACTPRYLSGQLNAYVQAQERKGLAAATIRSKELCARRFLNWLEDESVTTVSMIGVGHVHWLYRQHLLDGSSKPFDDIVHPA